MLWLEGPTRIDLNPGPNNWRAEWTLDESPGAPRQLAIDLDPGLEAVEVIGPRVRSFRIEPAGPASRLSISLKGEGSGPSPLTIVGVCQVPVEGTWSIPSARPVDAIWTGGRTVVRLDDSRVLQSCEPRASRRVSPVAGEPGELPTLIFEPNGDTGPIAVLTFRQPVDDASVDVRGLLRLGDQPPRMEVGLTWTVERGRMLSRAVDLPVGWVADRVLSYSGQSMAWHAEPLSSGASRVFISLPSGTEENRSATLTLFASATEAGVTGPLDLPRVRPAPGPRVVDEIWAATSEPGFDVRPILASGLAWIDPPDPPLDEVPTPWVADDLRDALAWRWLMDDAEGRIDRVASRDHPRGEVKLEATIRSDRLKLHWSLAVDSPRADLRLVPIYLNMPFETPIRWRSREVGGPAVEVRRIDESRRAVLGFPETGSAFDLELSGPSRGRVQIEGDCEVPWNGVGGLPLLALPGPFLTRGLVRLMVEDSTRVAFDSSGLTPIDSSTILSESSSREETAGPARGAKTRQAGLFSYRSASGRLRLIRAGRARSPCRSRRSRASRC